MRLPQKFINRTLAAAALVASILLAACRSTVAPDRALSVATDRERYERAGPEQRVSVAFTARNVASETLFLGRCGPAVATYVDRHEAGEWVEYLSSAVICPAVYEMAPLALAPAELLTPPALLLGPGVYRLRVPFGFSFATPYDRTAISNPFVVE